MMLLPLVSTVPSSALSSLHERGVTEHGVTGEQNDRIQQQQMTEFS